MELIHINGSVTRKLNSGSFWGGAAASDLPVQVPHATAAPVERSRLLSLLRSLFKRLIQFLELVIVVSLVHGSDVSQLRQLQQW